VSALVASDEEMPSLGGEFSVAMDLECVLVDVVFVVVERLAARLVYVILVCRGVKRRLIDFELTSKGRLL
jgi:hypothetical protein